MTRNVGEGGLLSISLPEPYSKSDLTEIAFPLPWFNRE